MSGRRGGEECRSESEWPREVTADLQCGQGEDAAWIGMLALLTSEGPPRRGRVSYTASDT